MSPSRPASARPRTPRPALWAAALALSSLAPAQAAQDALDLGVALPVGVALRPQAGTTRVEPGEYLRVPSPEDGAVIVLEGLNGVLLDLEGVELRGAPREVPAEDYAGVGILLRDCTGVTLRGGELGGFRACIVAERCTGLTIEGTRFEQYHARRLLSTHTALDAADRLELDAGPEAWVASYGAALFLADCTDATLVGCRARAGQNGAVVARTRGLRIERCDFSFLSGWGAALVECEDAVLAHNRFEGCVRGYSHEIFVQDFGAAGVYMLDCSGTRLLDSSLTHGSLAARLEGGTNNLVARCDFSHGVAGGLRVTRELGFEAHGNLLEEGLAFGIEMLDCEAAVVAGNSLESVRGAAVRVLGGRDTLVLRNVLKDSEVGLALRSSSARVRATWVEANSFDENDNDLQFVGALDTTLRDNVFPSQARGLTTRDLVDEAGRELSNEALEGLLAGLGGWLPSGSLDGGSLRPVDLERPPAAREEALTSRLPSYPGELPDRVGPAVGRESIVLGGYFPWDFASGAERPPTRAGGLLSTSRWDARWFSWREGPDPRGSLRKQAEWRARAQEPDLRVEVGAWLSPYGDGLCDDDVRSAVGTSRFGLVATTSIQLEAGRYRLSVVSDDGVRLRVDGGAVIQNWSWHPAKRNTVDLRMAAGLHELTLEYFQIDGAAALTVDLVRLSEDPAHGERALSGAPPQATPSLAASPGG